MMFTSREDAIQWIDEVCRERGGHDIDIDRLFCRCCGTSCEMLDDLYYETRR